MEVKFDFEGVREGQDMETQKIMQLCKKLKENVGKVIVGKKELIELMAISLVCSGHILLEDVPGTGKTLLAKTVAASMNSTFRRMQFTPDLLPSDLSGIHYYNQKMGEFVFNPGPVFTNILLADEINRATPRTQASLLECMEEKQVTIDGITKKLDEPFMVIATQNPIETLGTFPLPEAQLDRFFMKLSMGYPKGDEGVDILKRFLNENPFENIEGIIEKEEILEVREQVKRVFISEELLEYIVRLAEASRSREDILLGISPRATQALMKAAQVRAAFSGRNYVIPDDIKELAVPVLSHRLVVESSGFEKNQSEKIINEILDIVPVPAENL